MPISPHFLGVFQLQTVFCGFQDVKKKIADTGEFCIVLNSYSKKFGTFYPFFEKSTLAFQPFGQKKGYFWLLIVLNESKLCFISKNIFRSILWILLSCEKKSLSKKCILRQMQRIWMLYGKKTLKNRQKSTFFLRASEKRVIYVLFKNPTLCELKVRRSLPKKNFGLIEHFLTILW